MGQQHSHKTQHLQTLTASNTDFTISQTNNSDIILQTFGKQ